MSTTESDHLKIFVINSGSVWKAKLSSNSRINKLMSLSVAHFHGPSALLKSLKHRLVHVQSREILSGEKSLAEEGLKDNDEVLLVEFRASSKQTLPDLRGPTEAEIYEATKDLETQNTEKCEPKLMETEDDLHYSERFAKDSPRIFITLLETAAYLLAYAPHGMEVIQQVKKEMFSKREPALHSPYVKQLTDMGFPEQMVLKALATKRMNVSEAIEWLLEQSSSSKEIDPHDEASTSQSQTLTVTEAFQDLLRSALRKRQENFKLNKNHVKELKIMGYEEKEIETALRETDNNMKAAINWLAENNSHVLPEKNGGSLDSNGPMFKALITSDLVQLNLRKPKFLLALLSILEDPQCLSLWLKDQEISCILNHLMLMHNTESSGGRRIY